MDFNYEELKKQDSKAMHEVYPRMRESDYEDLVTIKMAISQILLKDTKKAAIFLQEYNDIIENEENLGMDIQKRIVDLKFKLDEYEKNEGKEKTFSEQGRVIEQRIEYLKQNNEKLDIKDFEQQFQEMKDIYNENSQNYSHSDKDTLEASIYSLQAQLVMRKVREGDIDLYDEISEKDAKRLLIVINNQLYALMQNKSYNIQSIVNEIKYKMINREDAVYDPEVWRLFDKIQGNQQSNTLQQQNIAKRPITQMNSTPNNLLPALPKKRRFEPLQMFKRNKLKLNSDYSMPIKHKVQIDNYMVRVKDLSKINCEWLASRMPREMLDEIENAKLNEENRSDLKERYIPDSQTPIYNYFEFEDNKTPIRSFEYINEEGVLSSDVRIKINGTDNKTAIEYKFYFNWDIIKEFTKTIEYASFIDKCTGSNIGQELRSEIGIFIEKMIFAGDRWQHIFKDKYHKLPIFSNLNKSRDSVKKYVEETKLSFSEKERHKRDEFYDTHNFKNTIIATVSDSSDIAETEKEQEAQLENTQEGQEPEN